MSTIFIALQCSQCSTMQVKQRRKSGNKWTCVVCNQKQSVRKVFAQGPMAKDLRKFVQDFNMSRKAVDERDFDRAEDEGTEASIPLPCRFEKKRRSDWSEYLDVDGDCGRNGDARREDSEFEGKLVTELPAEVFKKPKLKDSTNASVRGGDEPLEPSLPNVNNNGKELSSKERYKVCEWTTAKFIRHGASNDDQDVKPRKNCQGAAATGTSKWSEYATEEDYDIRRGNGKNFKNNQADQWSDMILETLATYEMVEDDIHPEFK